MPMGKRGNRNSGKDDQKFYSKLYKKFGYEPPEVGRNESEEVTRKSHPPSITERSGEKASNEDNYRFSILEWDLRGKAIREAVYRMKGEAKTDEDIEVYSKLEEENNKTPLNQHTWREIVEDKVREINRKKTRKVITGYEKYLELIKMAESRAEEVMKEIVGRVDKDSPLFKSQVKTEYENLVAKEFGIKRLSAENFPYPLTQEGRERDARKENGSSSSSSSKIDEPDLVKRIRKGRYLCLHPSGYNLPVVRVESDRVIVRGIDGIEMPILFNRLDDYRWVSI